MNIKREILIPATIFSVALPSMAATTTENPLNVILILTDDQGYGDVGYTGNPNVNTPELDQLAIESQRFDNFHTGTTSAPTRSGIMTGRHGNSTGVWHTVGGRSLLDLEEYTLAQAFKDSGYATAMYGKWHLGDNYPYRPIERGFDDVLYHKGGGVGQTPDFWGNTYFEDTYYRNNDIEEPQTGYCTDIWFGEAERFINENREKPFFCYLAVNAPHGPYNVDERYAAPYRNNPNIPIPEFYGMIENVDYNIGKLRSLLERLDLDDNTVIIFLGDNGSAGGAATDKDGYLKRGYNGGFRGTKCMVYEGGHRQSMLMHVPMERAAMSEELTTYADIMPTLINLCSLTPSRMVDYDGVDILSDESRSGRVFVVDTQRGENLNKQMPYCVMRDDWRMINGNELYDLSGDREQRHNIAKDYPQIMSELTEEYDKWWAHSAKDRERIQYIPIATNVKGESVDINCHDIHDTEDYSVWNQEMIHKGSLPRVGWWTINVPKSGKYNVELYRWSPTANLGFDAPTPAGRKTPNGVAYLAGGAIEGVVKSAKIVINGETTMQQSDIDTSKPSILFKDVKFVEGNHKITIEIEREDGTKFSPLFVRFTQK